MSRASVNITVILFMMTAVVSTALGQKSYSLKYGYAKDTPYRYELSSAGSTTQEMMGQEMKIGTNVSIVSTFHVEEVRSDGALVLIMAIESGSIAVKNPMMDTTMSLDAFKGKRRQLVLDSHGSVLDRHTIDSVALGGMMGGSLQQDPVRFHMLPTSDVSIGGTWNASKTDTTKGMGGSIFSTTDVNYTVLGLEERLGRMCLKISYEGTIMTEGTGSMQGMDLFMEGTGKTMGTLFFDPAKGMLVYDDSSLDSETTIALTGQQNMTIPMTQSMKITQAIVP